MKILKIIIVSFLVLIVLIGTGLFVFIKTFDLNRYKQPIAAVIERSLGRTVDYGKSSLDWSLEKGIRVQIRDLTVKENKAFGTGDFLSAQAVDLGVSIKDLFLKRQITILNVIIRAPKITVTRLSDGRINVLSMNPDPSVSVPAQQAKPAQKTPAVTSMVVPVPALVISRIKVEGGSVKFVDRQISPEMVLELKKIDIAIDDFTVGKPFAVSMSAAFLSDSANMSAKGQAKVDLSTQIFQLSNLVYKTDFVSLPLEKLRRAIPAMHSMPSFEMPAGRVEVTVKRMEIGSEGIRSLSVDAEIRDGKFSFTQPAGGIPLQLSGIIVVAKDLSLTKPFDFRLSAAYLNAEQNIVCKGTGQIFLKDQAFQITNGEVFIDAEKISLAKLADAIPALKSVQQFKGKCTMSLERLRVGSSGLIALKGAVQLKQGSLQLKEMGMPVEALELSCVLNETTIQCVPFSFSVGKGNVEGSAIVDQYAGDQKYTVTGKVKEVDLGQVLNQQDYPVKVAGIASGDISLNGQGFDPQASLKNLTGKGSFDVKDGKLTDINVLKLILDKFTFIPNLSDIIEKNLPENIRSQLVRKDTPITSARVVAVLSNGIVSLEPAHVEAEGFVYDGQGTVGLNQEYAVAGNFKITKDVAAKIVSSDSSLGFLLSPEQDVRFPVKIEGKGAQFKIIPDVSLFSKQMLQQKAQQELNKVLDKVFDGKKNEPAASDTVGGQAQGAATPAGAATTEPQAVSEKEKQKQEQKEAIKGLIESFIKKEK